MKRNRIGPALGKISSGLYILTAARDGKSMGMLASFIEQAAFEPPMISVAIADGRPIAAVLDHEGVFGVNVLSGRNSALMRFFAKPREDASFEGHQTVENEYHVPQLAEALAFLACKVVSKTKAGDHWLYLAEVLDGCLQNGDGEPIVRARKNGFSY